MFRTLTLSAAALTLAAPVAANAALLFNFAGAGTTQAQTFVFASSPAQTPAVTITAASRIYSGSLGNLSQLSQLNPSPYPNVIRTTAGIGVPGGANDQLDTNGATRREALLLTSNAPLSLTNAFFRWTDENDTVKIYGVGAGGALTTLAQGSIRNGFAGVTVGPISANAGNANGNFAQLNFNPALPVYSQYLFTTQLNGSNSAGQGYFLTSVSGNAVPEPATWAMMIFGFGAIGATIRYRRRTVAVA